MAVSSASSFGLVVLVSLICAALISLASAQSPAPAPTSDATSVDQALAYLLMLVALLLTYIIH